MIRRIEELLEHEVAGDPCTGLKWTRRTTEKIAAELRALGIEICANTVARLLRQLNFSLRVNHKKLSRGSGPDRDEQFAYIAERRERFALDGQPIVSIDTKKKELVGNFRNPGSAWTREPVLVGDHDFPSDALGKAIPYGIYDLLANRGTVFVGTSHDTPDFAADNLARWWEGEGQHAYPHATDLLVLADGGGSNSPRCRAFKYGLQTRFCNVHELVVTVCHYPTGASKWNPIEHRLFSEISKNWQGRPLESYELILQYLRSTRTTTGLTVSAHLVQEQYPKGVRISDRQMKGLNLDPHQIQPNRNYTIYPTFN